MIDTTVVIPCRDQPPRMAEIVDQTATELRRLPGGGEILIVDEGRGASDIMSTLCEQATTSGSTPVRAVRLDQAAGISAALTVAFRMARGEHLIVMHPSYSDYVQWIGPLRKSLVRADLVVARQRHAGVSKIVHRIARVPRFLLLGLEVRDPECLFWAARQEAIRGLELPRGMYRYLSTLVAARGFRVGEMVVDWPARPRGDTDGRPNPGDLICAWWLKRRWPQYRIEWMSDGTEDVQIHPLSSHALPVPQPPVTPLTEPERRRSA